MLNNDGDLGWNINNWFSGSKGTLQEEIKKLIDYITLKKWNYIKIQNWIGMTVQKINKLID